MKLIMAGIHQRTAPIEVRGKLAFSPDTMLQALESLHKLTYASFIISTCNRVEIYALVADEIDGKLLLQTFLSQWHHVESAFFADYLSFLLESEVVHHIFALASGIDSVVLGEDQILSQIKEAQLYAKQAHCLNKILNKLLDKTLEVGKRVRSQTQISQHHLSTVSLALKIARQQDGSFEGKSVVVLGAGRIAELVLKHLHGANARSVTVINRTHARAEALALIYAVNVRPFAEVADALRSCDVCISCITVPKPLFSTGDLPAMMPDRHYTIIDLAVPYSIDVPRFRSHQHTYITLDDIQGLAEENRAARGAEIEDVQHIIDHEVAEFLEWLNIQHVVPTISALRQRAERIRQEELQKTLRRLGSLDEHQQQLVQAMSVAIVNTLLHEPITLLRNSPDDAALAQAVNQLFQLSEPRKNHVEHV